MRASTFTTFHSVDSIVKEFTAQTGIIPIIDDLSFTEGAVTNETKKHVHISEIMKKHQAQQAILVDDNLNELSKCTIKNGIIPIYVTSKMIELKELEIEINLLKDSIKNIAQTTLTIIDEYEVKQQNTPIPDKFNPVNGMNSTPQSSWGWTSYLPSFSNFFPLVLNLIILI